MVRVELVLASKAIVEARASAYEWMPNGSHASDKLRPQGVALQNATQPKSAKEIADIAGVAPLR